MRTKQEKEDVEANRGGGEGAQDESQEEVAWGLNERTYRKKAPSRSRRRMGWKRDKRGDLKKGKYEEEGRGGGEGGAERGGCRMVGARGE